MILDRNDLPRDWGPSALNVTSQSSMSTTYELPFAKKLQAYEESSSAAGN